MRFNDLCSDILSGLLLVLIVAACVFIAAGLQPDILTNVSDSLVRRLP